MSERNVSLVSSRRAQDESVKLFVTNKQLVWYRDKIPIAYLKKGGTDLFTNAIWFENDMKNEREGERGLS